ncbi:MAG TPA: DUF721 domain-containing protein [Candidatus Cloacimonadota bacterium]|nr:DUF721 domain-containing protein [Candidatus Cloacimonadota bacterium]
MFNKDFSSACRQVIYRLGGEKYAPFIAACYSWKDAVGPLLAEKSRPLKVENGILYVAVSNNSWMQELVLLKSKILARYRREPGLGINDIIFVIKAKLYG